MLFPNHFQPICLSVDIQDTQPTYAVFGRQELLLVTLFEQLIERVLVRRVVLPVREVADGPLGANIGGPMIVGMEDGFIKTKREKDHAFLRVFPVNGAVHFMITYQPEPQNV